MKIRLCNFNCFSFKFYPNALERCRSTCRGIWSSMKIFGHVRYLHLPGTREIRGFRVFIVSPHVVHVSYTSYISALCQGRRSRPVEIRGVLARGCLNARALFLSPFFSSLFRAEKRQSAFLPISQGVTTQTRTTRRRTEARTCARIDYARRYSNLPRTSRHIWRMFLFAITRDIAWYQREADLEYYPSFFFTEGRVKR